MLASLLPLTNTTNLPDSKPEDNAGAAETRLVSTEPQKCATTNVQMGLIIAVAKQ